MPSLKTITPLLGGNYYHLFNRGVNRQKIFFQERNYSYFLKLVDQFLTDYVIILAYALLPNHFHFVVKIKDRIYFKDSVIDDEILIGKVVVNQLKRMFITYSMSINIQEGRDGSLFEPKYKRLIIEENEYLLNAISYVHFNPENHEIINNFREYEYSSYNSLISGGKSIVNTEYTLEIFDGMEGFINYHQVMHDSISEIDLE
jgi:REP element-mobilizing transposase RayT